MTTTVDQKGGIIYRWWVHRLERGLDADVSAQCKFNWPSLSYAEIEEVVKAYQRRNEMAKNEERPSAPKKLAKHVIKCVLGPRLYIENFTNDKSARAFLELVVGKEKPKWKTDTMFTTHDDNCEISTAHLEELWEMPSPGITLAEPIPSTVKNFFGGQWKGMPKVDVGEKTREKIKETSKARTTREKRVAVGSNGEDLVTLDHLCKQNKWEPRRVRAAMRGASWEKPGSGWAWPATDAGKIEKALSKLMKS